MAVAMPLSQLCKAAKHINKIHNTIIIADLRGGLVVYLFTLEGQRVEFRRGFSFLSAAQYHKE